MRIKKNKSEQVETSILSTIKLLNMVLDHPSNFATNETIRNALKSQNGLAGLTYTDEANAIEITPLSITTLKSKVTSLSKGFDFKSFDSLRKQALEALLLIDASQASAIEPSLPNEQPIIPSKVKLANKIVVLESRLEKHREANFRLLQALNRAVTALENTSKTDGSALREKIARDEIFSITKTLMLNDHPFNALHRPVSIVPLNQET